MAHKANTKMIGTAIAAATAPKKGVVVKSLRIRADHLARAEVAARLMDGNEVTILSTWALIVYDGKTYIKLLGGSENSDRIGAKLTEEIMKWYTLSYGER